MADLSWFQKAGLGLFIHWDQASQQGVEISWPMAGLPGLVEEMHAAEYQSSADSFNPVRWNASEVARLARSCGAQYIVFTARHHAGYSMFHTKHSDFSIEHSPFHADLTRQIIEAARTEGLRIGIYYSLLDWNHPDYPALQDSDKPYPSEHSCPNPEESQFRRPSPEAWHRFLEYVRGQLTELLTNYGPIDILWFDGQWERTASEWQAAELRTYIASLQPDLIVNDRLPGQGDYQTPEQDFPSVALPGPWELCLTMNESWGWRPTDTNYKSARLLARNLIDTVSRGGNLLLNLSPTGDGSLPDIQVARLKELGEWLQTHGESVIGVRPAPATLDFYGPATTRQNRLYLHLVADPIESIIVRNVPVHRVREVTLLGTNEPLVFDRPRQHVGVQTDGEQLGQLTIDAPSPTSALSDVIAIDFDVTVEPR